MSKKTTSSDVTPSLNTFSEGWRNEVWRQLKEQLCSGDALIDGGWTTGESAAYRGFFNHGVDAVIAALSANTFKGTVTGGDAGHNTVTVTLDDPAPWADLPIGSTRVDIVLASKSAKLLKEPEK